MNLLGMLYENGWGVAKDVKLALKWYQESASLDYPQGIFNAARLKEQNRGAKKNAITTLDNYKSAADKGVKSAQEHLARMYESGTGGAPLDYKEAMRLYELAAKQGSDLAETAIGRFHSEGLGVKRNQKLAFDHWKKAAEKGNPAASYYIGEALLSGAGCKKDIAAAVDWIKKAAEADHPSAQYRFGSMYEHGKVEYVHLTSLIGFVVVHSIILSNPTKLRVSERIQRRLSSGMARAQRKATVTASIRFVIIHSSLRARTSIDNLHATQTNRCLDSRTRTETKSTCKKTTTKS